MVYYMLRINFKYKNGFFGRRIPSQNLIKQNGGARAFKELSTSEQECKAHARKFLLFKRTDYKMYSSIICQEFITN